MVAFPGMDRHSRIFVAGHRGLAGSAIVRRLEREGFQQLILRSREDLDLLDQRAVNLFFRNEKPTHVFLAAARAGGIGANSAMPVEFLYENLTIATNVIQAAAETGVEKLLYLGSSCIYPRLAAQPIAEDSLLTGPLERTNEAYAIAKIAGLKLCEYHNRQYGRRFISAMPTNLYGPNDNFDPDRSHVIPGLLHRFHTAAMESAETVTIWGTGAPLREFLHVDDLADALLLLMRDYDGPETVNIGSGAEISIRDLAEMVRDVTGSRATIRFDPSRPDGTPRKLLDSTRIRSMGWQPSIELREGLRQTWEWYREKVASPRSASD